ncbi:MAG: MBL fold metallo-hydrolase [Anaerolineales bacterium]|nr:MBL fold metallo-hydrolase [Anaerolineales bacterium]
MSNQNGYAKDVFSTSLGELALHFLGHGSLRLTFGGKEIYADPFREAADYSALPKADLILVTHHHSDHFDPQAIAAIRTGKTQIVCTAICAENWPGGIVMCNDDLRTFEGISIEAVPAYNIAHKRPNGQPFHIPGEGNGYILAFGDRRVYLAGDTENIPEMKRLGKIDIAFLPVNLPYTMSVEMAAEAARMIRPRIFYPYHYGETDLSLLTALMKDEKEIEIRIRRMA